MSVNKLLARIVSPLTASNGADAASAHEQSYGITSDPLTQWSCLIAALAHDVVCYRSARASLLTDHLVAESPRCAKHAIHKGKSNAWAKV